MSESFATELYGKCILSGEHAVLRGASALVFPVFERRFKLHYAPASGELEVDFLGEYGDEMRLLFHGVLERALKKLGKSTAHLTGRFEVYNDIPVGAGMGASAALCVGVTQWLLWKSWIGTQEIYAFATELENLFHGESSGVDIAVALKGEGLLFSRSTDLSPIQPRWQPCWYLSYSGQKGLTSVCVEKVQRLRARDPDLGKQLDERMNAATLLALKALSESEEGGFEQLASAIHLASSCFTDWGLVESDLKEHLEELKRKGAHAVKPTGSGMGGFVLSLWKRPPAELPSSFIPLVSKKSLPREGET